MGKLTIVLTNLDILLTKHDIEWLSQAINGESWAQPTSQKRQHWVLNTGNPVLPLGCKLNMRN
jgi:hypothetical protein